MLFSDSLSVDIEQAAQTMGYRPNAPIDDATADTLRECADLIERAVSAKWVYRIFSLLHPGHLEAELLRASGEDLTRHLSDCTEVVLVAVTLGAACDDLSRKTQVEDIRRSVLLDASASVLAEQYADEAERILRKKAKDDDLFLTNRFSPGYGSVSLGVQPLFLRLLDAQRAIGLTVTGGALLPRKSITAFLGRSPVSVQGRQIDCDDCSIKQNCDRQRCMRGRREICR